MVKAGDWDGERDRQEAGSMVDSGLVTGSGRIASFYSQRDFPVTKRNILVLTGVAGQGIAGNFREIEKVLYRRNLPDRQAPMNAGLMRGRKG